MDESDCWVRLPGDDTAWWEERITEQTPTMPLFDPEEFLIPGGEFTGAASVNAFVVRVASLVGKIGRFNVHRMRTHTTLFASKANTTADGHCPHFSPSAREWYMIEAIMDEYKQLSEALDALWAALPEEISGKRSGKAKTPSSASVSDVDGTASSNTMVTIVPGVTKRLLSPWESYTPVILPLDVLFFRIFYNCAVLMLHDFGMFGPKPPHTSWDVSDARYIALKERKITGVVKARKAAENITEILWLQHIMTRTDLKSATGAIQPWYQWKIGVADIPYASYCIYRAGAIHLGVVRSTDAMFSQQDRIRALVMARQCQEILTAISRCVDVAWEMGRKHAEQLNEAMQTMDFVPAAATISATPPVTEQQSSATLPTVNGLDEGSDDASSDLYALGAKLGLLPMDATLPWDMDSLNAQHELQYEVLPRFTENDTLLERFDAERRNIMLRGLEEFDLDAELAALLYDEP